jgi:hypothetical protein
MMRRWFSGIFFSAFILAQANTSAADRDKTQKSIQRGVRALKSLQAADGYWTAELGQHRVGATALAGLALLESNVPKTDASVQRAARFLRKNWLDTKEHFATYSLALMILFFDRLGDPADTIIVQASAARLLGGQNAEGWWSYSCPAPSAEELRWLRSMLQAARSGSAGPVRRDANDRPILGKEILQFIKHMEEKGPPETPVTANGRTGAMSPLAQPGGLQPGRGGRGVRGGRGGQGAPSPETADAPIPDNSNTQYALFGLWAARRHGIPVEKALARAAEHFRKTQHGDGGWGYRSADTDGRSTVSMTCAGLLGLALGYASAREVTLASAAAPGTGTTPPPSMPPDPAKDPAIRSGFDLLAQDIGRAVANPNRPGGHISYLFYTFWAIERVGMAYERKLIGGKDWYDWGTDYLLRSQQTDGTWRGGFGTHVRTAWALLFLSRANVTRDLSSFMRARPDKSP